MDVRGVVGTIDGVGSVDVAVGAGFAADVFTDDATGIVVPKKSVANDVAGVADSDSGAVELAVVAAREAAVSVRAAAGGEGGGSISPTAAGLAITGTHRAASANCSGG